MLTEDEKKRYLRHMGIPSWDPGIQEKLKNSSVFVAGAGGLGSSLLYYLVSAGIGNITICDYDRVDLSNLNRQILHNEKSIGTLKVDSAMETLASLNHNVNINPFRGNIESSEVNPMIENSDIIIDCLDSFSSRHVLNRYSVLYNKPLIHAGVSEFHGQIAFLQPPETACLACFMPATDDGTKPSVMGATAGMFGCLEALEAIKFLSGMGGNLKNKLFIWDCLSMTGEKINLSKNTRCTVCGKL